MAGVAPIQTDLAGDTLVELMESWDGTAPRGRHISHPLALMISVQEFPDDIAFFCPVGMDDGPVHDLRLWKRNWIAEIVANGLRGVTGEMSGDFAVPDSISDDKDDFKLDVRTIPKLCREREKIFRGRPARKRFFAAGYVLRAFAM